MASPHNLGLKLIPAILLISLIEAGTSLPRECGNNSSLTKGNIFEGKKMNESMSFYGSNVSTIHGCHHACRYNCRCSSVVYKERNSSTGFNCLLYDVANVTEYLLNDSFANVTYFHVKVGFLECPTNCSSVLYSNSNSNSAIYELVLDKHEQPIKTVCDMETDSGGWTLLQRRIDGSVDFSQGWSAYKNGFGNLDGEFWLGLDAAHELMKDGDMTLRFDLWDGNDYAYAEYHYATIASEMDNYRFNFMSYEGDAGDAMKRHNNSMFSTKDRDNDTNNNSNCASLYSGAWWFVSCHDANLNGNYGDSRHAKGITWKQWRTHSHSLSKTEMKIKRNG